MASRLVNGSSWSFTMFIIGFCAGWCSAVMALGVQHPYMLAVMLLLVESVYILGCSMAMQHIIESSRDFDPYDLRDKDVQHLFTTMVMLLAMTMSAGQTMLCYTAIWLGRVYQQPLYLIYEFHVGIGFMVLSMIIGWCMPVLLRLLFTHAISQEDQEEEELETDT